MTQTQDTATTIDLDAGEVLIRSVFFGTLGPEARADLVAQMRCLRVPAGTVLVREGEEGDTFYLIARGDAEVWASRGAPAPTVAGAPWTPQPGRHTLLAHRGPGEAFGEMALLHGGPRSATVRAATDLVLYTLDKDTFTRVINQYRGLAVTLEEEMALRGAVTFLGRGSPFSDLPPEALGWLATRLEPITVAAGAEVVRQGEPGDAFYIVRSGRLDALIATPDGGEQSIGTMGPGEPFGEKALITGEPRSATVRALEPAEVLRLSREDFEAVIRMHRERGTYFVQLTMQRQRPRRIDDWVMEEQRGRDGEVVHVLKDTRHNHYMKLSEQGAFLWQLMDGQRTIRDLTLAYFARYQVFGLDAVMGAMLQLSAAGFLHVQRIDRRRLGEVAELNRLQKIGQAVLPWMTRYFSLPDVNALVTALYRHLLHPLYSRPAQCLILGVVLAGAALFARFLVPGGSQLPTTSVPGLAGAALVGLLIQGLLHELGHAATTKHFGREVHRAGVGWYFLLPVAFVDTSDIWLAGRGPRMAVAFAGPYVNFVLSGLASLLMLVIADPVEQVLLFQFAITGYVIGLINMNPLIERDGYYVLMDLLDVPNLRAKALAFIGALAWRAGRTTRDPRLARIFAGYGALTLLYTGFVAISVLTGYQSLLRGAVSQALPPLAASALGWLAAGLMATLVLFNAWRGLRVGVQQVRRAGLRRAGA